MIEFVNVSKIYEDGYQPLSQVSFIINKGEMVFLTGDSATGKTTLFKLIMLIEQVTRGQIFVDGKNIQQLSPRDIPFLRRQIGMISQNPNLLADHTIFDNVALPLEIAGIRRQKMKQRVNFVLDKLGLLNKALHFPTALSSGEQVLVAMARAIVNQPIILLADEPTKNLDSILGKRLMSLLQELSGQGVTVLVATHDLALIAAFNQRLLVIKKGNLIGR